MRPIAFLQARDYRKGRRDPKTGLACPVRNVVIHTAEIGESLDGAEALMRACARGRPPKADGSPDLASWHYSIDADSVTQSVRESDTAFHAPGLSHCSIGLEHSGRARQSALEWQDEFSIRTLELSAELVAGICTRHEIPIRRVSAAELVAGAAGLCGHADVRDAFKRTSHWDPGPAFPWNYYIERILHHHRNADTLPDNPIPTIAPDLPTLRRGDQGAAVVTMQERLNVHGALPSLKMDGDFGPRTEGALRSFQRGAMLVVDGVCGRYTWQELFKS